MNSAPIEFHKIWIDQCAATEDIHEKFGLDDALNYLIGEKLFSFLHAAERDPLFAAEIPYPSEHRTLLCGGVSWCT